MLLQIDPVNVTVWLNVGLFYLAAALSFAAAAISFFVRKRSGVAAAGLILFGVVAAIFSTRYGQLVVPGFPGGPVTSGMVRPYFFLLGVGMLLVPIGHYLLERSYMMRAELETSLLAMREEMIQLRESVLVEREALAIRRENFITTLLHEINTPLTPLLAYAIMIRESQTLEEAKDFAAHFQNGTQRFMLMKLMSDARLKPLQPTAIQICNLTDQLLMDELVYVATRRTPADSVVTVSCEPFVVEADRDKLYFALLEFVRNGLKSVPYERDGERVVAKVDVKISRPNGRYRIEVTDNGRGIPQQDWRRIWQPGGAQLFDNILTRPNEGAGFGLHTVRLIAEAHGGTADIVWSEEGVGSRFVLELPTR